MATKCCEAGSLKFCDSQTVAEALFEIFKNFGVRVYTVTEGHVLWNTLPSSVVEASSFNVLSDYWNILI